MLAIVFSLSTKQSSLIQQYVWMKCNATVLGDCFSNINNNVIIALLFFHVTLPKGFTFYQ